MLPRIALLGVLITASIAGVAQRVEDLPQALPYKLKVNQAGKSQQWKSAIKVPAMFGMAAMYAFSDDSYVNRFELHEERNEWMPSFRVHVDDYLQYAPIVATYALNLAGVQGENNFGNRTALLIKTEALTAALTFSLKRLTAVPRPDTGERNSFPSGHTAQAFAAATFMAKEYGSVNKLYSVGAYAVATSIGTLRMMNNRHWLSDVLAGAGIGILSANVVYLTHQYKWGDKRKRRSTILPMYTGTGPGVYYSYTFH